MYRGPGAAANGPFHHYVFELYALDTKLDVKPSGDAFETRANVMRQFRVTSWRKRSTGACSDGRSNHHQRDAAAEARSLAL